MSATPILFSGPMIRALIEGRKTQTRRLALRLPYVSPDFPGVPSRWQKVRPGDLLWVRERWCDPEGDRRPVFFADLSPSEQAEHDALARWSHRLKGSAYVPWRPSIHMPRWASRLTLEVTAVRIERLQEISEEDAIAEGATSRPRCYGFNNDHDGWSMDWSQVGRHSKYATGGAGPLKERDISLYSPIEAFGSFINELHGGPRWNLQPTNLWYENPEVVVISFKVHVSNVDALPTSIGGGRR